MTDFSAEDRCRFETFLFHEARLMDDSVYEDWFALWAPELLYWVPCNQDDPDPAHQISLIYDDREKLEDRVLRLRSRFAHAQTPRSRLIRSVTNIELEAADATSLSGWSCFVLGEIRLDQQTTWFGRSHHVLAQTEDGLRIARKKVVLLNNDGTIGNLTFLI